MTLLWVTEHFVTQRPREATEINVSTGVYGNFALKPLQIGEIMSNNKILQFSYFYWNTNEKKADEKTTLFLDGIYRDCDIA